MLPKEHRMSRALFSKLWGGGRKFHTPLFTLVYMKNHEGKGRFSAVISKKVAKKAVVRNRLRRTVYRAVDGAGGRKLAILAIFILKPEAAKTPDLAGEIASTLKKL